MAQRLHGTDEYPTGKVQHERDRHESAGQQEADGERSRLPRRDADQARADHSSDSPLHPVEPWQRRHVLPQQQRRLHAADLQERNNREQHRHQHADREALNDRTGGESVLDVQHRCEVADKQRQQHQHDAGHRHA